MKGVSLFHVGAVAIVGLVSAGPVGAQDTRAEIESEARSEKAQSSSSAAAPERGFFEQAFTWATKKLDGSKDGFYPELGGLIPGSGWLGIGPGYRRHLFGDAALVDASAAISSRRYSMMQSRIEWPKLASDHVSLGAQVRYQDFTEIDYFGIGPHTSKADQTDSRLQSLDIVGSATARPRDWFAVGARVGYMRSLNIEPGLSSIHPPTHERFDDTNAPGLTAHPRHEHADVFVEADLRDVPGYPTSGGIYRVGFAAFHDLDGSGYSFRRVEVDAAQYVPLFHKNWVVALRGRMALSQTASGQQVPFYQMPTLGGENSLRAYGDYRFRDRNVALVGAEYRWPVLRMIDGALFADAGTVGPTAGELWHARPNVDFGFGLRLHSTTRSIARLDVAKGREGMRVVASLRAPLRGASRSVAPYVP
jgi:outer membrane protein assembly factor BamA